MYISVNLLGYKGNEANLFALSNNYYRFITSFMSFHGINVEMSEPTKNFLVFALDSPFHSSHILGLTLVKLFYRLLSAFPQNEVSGMKLLGDDKFYFHHLNRMITLNINPKK